MSELAAISKLVSKRKPLHHNDVPFMVCWAQKAGCTAILKWFLYHAGLLDEAIAYGSKKPGQVNSIHKYENEVFKSREGYTAELIDKLRGNSPVINFVRDPYARAFSSYMHIHKPIYVAYPNWKAPGLDIRKKILSDLYGDASCIEYPISFHDYLCWLTSQDLDTLDPHHRPQYNPLFDTVIVEHFRLDDLAAIAISLEERFGLPGSEHAIVDVFASEHHIEKLALERRAVLEFLTRGMPVTRSERFRPPWVTRHILTGTEMGRMIEQLFARDLQLYDAIRIPTR